MHCALIDLPGYLVETVSFVAHPDLQRVALFHGHYCPGLAIGYRAAQIALARLDAPRSEDEELVAIVENDSCAVDAVQVLTGCTFGKGNLVLRDHGKHVYTLALRPSGRAVRVSLRPRDDAALSRDERMRLLLEADDAALFTIRELTIELPRAAEVRASVVCAACGEPVMDTRSVRAPHGPLCRPCADRSAQ